MSTSDRSEMLRFACPRCDRPMQARAEYAGRKTRCPGCQHSLAIPGPGGAATAPAAVPPAGRASWLVGVGLVALLVAVGGAFAAWRFWPGGGPGPATSVQLAFNEYDDLDLLPATAQGVAVFRVADLWGRQATQKALADLRQRQPDRPDPAAELERNFGLAPAEVERLSLVLIDADDGLGYAVVRTGQPYDGPKLLSRLANAAEKTHQGVSYYAGAAANGQPAAACFVTPRVIIVGDEAGVKRGVEVLRAPAKQGPLAAAIERARGGKHHAVFGASPASGGTNELRKNALPIVADVKTATGTLDVTAMAVLDVRVEMPDEAKAKKLRDGVNTFRAAVPLLLLGLNLEPEQATKLAKLAGALKVAQKGAEVTLRAETDEETAVALLVMALSQAR